MNLRSQNIIGLLLAGLIIWSAAAGAQEPTPVPSGIVLNGITTIWGDHQAFFKVSFSGGVPEADFRLAEGQEKYGIQLLSVDAQLNTAAIRHQGQVQTIPICQTPTILARPASVTGSVASGKLGDKNRFGMTSAGNAPGSGNETQSALAQAGSAGSGGSQGSPNDVSGNGYHSSGNLDNNLTSANDSGANGSGGVGDNAAQGQIYQWWIKEAEKIERARLDTAPRVAAGEWPPYPLTPLTPSGTPAQLIGTDSLFMDHGPGVPIASH